MHPISGRNDELENNYDQIWDPGVVSGDICGYVGESLFRLCCAVSNRGCGSCRVIMGVGLFFSFGVVLLVF